ncbi:MAG: pseudouridine synthase [Prevotella sp.]
MDRYFFDLHNEIILPERLNCPFYYEPADICKEVWDIVRKDIESMEEWREEISGGKMFGVMVVRTADGKTGFLKAYSGQIGGREDWKGWVPAVFDYLSPDGYFVRREAEITEINRTIDNEECSMRVSMMRARLARAQEEAARKIDEYRRMMAESKMERDIRREKGEPEEALIRESQFQKAELKRLKTTLAAETKPLEDSMREHDMRMATLRKRRKEMSDSLQQWLFSNFIMTNSRGERRSLLDIFANTPQHIPPSGAGECCAPKLLQYAFTHGMKPVAMAEFWWGRSPAGEIRHHLSHYPACQGKCRPILDFMLQGLDVEPNPLEADETVTHHNIIYSDEWIVIIDKPAGMLSVPGKGIRLSAQEILCQELSCGDDGLLCIHRLDMQTSGLQMFARTAEVQREMQRRFAMRQVRKSYTALLDGEYHGPEEGVVALPLAADYINRPRQKVDYEHGKEAVTEYHVEEISGSTTRITLYPHTGRTHQLRIHCAHSDGLSIPIVGDDLYGHHASRLMLHATTLDFCHPVMGKAMHIEAKCPF